jgi:UDP-N-acetyl-D-galactosamine dehydrogenase
VILAGRRINDGMGRYVADQLIRLMGRKGLNPVGARILVLGLAFKEDCPDVRNTRVIDIVNELREYRAVVDVHDACVDVAAAEHEYGIRLCAEPAHGAYDAVVLAVAHREYRDAGAGVRGWLKPGGVLFDVKGVLPRAAVDGRL